MALTFLEKSHQYRMTAKPGPVDKRKNAKGEMLNPALRVTGATTILGGGVPKPALVDWSARMVAEFVRDNPLEVQRLRDHDGEDLDMVRELKAVPNRVRDAAAVRGTDVHAIAEKLIYGTPVVVPDEYEARVYGYIDLLDRFEIDPVLTERSIGNREHWYAGRFDSIMRIPALGDCLILGDWKTSNRVYGETALQTAAYSKAEFYVADDDPNTEIPMPEIARTMVCHISDQGSELYDLAKTPAEIDRHFEMFLAAAFTHKTAKERDGIITEPLTPEILASTNNTEMSAA